MKYIQLVSLAGLLMMACSSPKTNNYGASDESSLEVDLNYFKAANTGLKIETIDCTLSDGTKTKCYQITTKSVPTDHKMGPWCPESITDDKSAGGIWLKDGEVFDVDGAFVENLARFYNDETWKLYDANGDIFVTDTKEDCIGAARPDLGDSYANFCVECLPSYVEDISQTYVIPIKPLKMADPIAFMGSMKDRSKEPKDGSRPPQMGDRPPHQMGSKPPKHEAPAGGSNSAPSARGLALNGIEFSAPAPLSNILEAYTVAPFDDAGGHVNVHQGYHYHAATGISFSIKQDDGHAPLIGYAMDGFGIYAEKDENGNKSLDLDTCRGHYDEVRGYHYHVDAAGSNNFINCLHGAYAQ